MNALGNFLGYQTVWFIAVGGAGRGLVWPALVAFAVFAVWQLGISRTRGADLRLLGLALVLGALLDGALARSGALCYAAARPALPDGGAPLWILALWCAFALTFNHSLAWLKHRSWTAAALGAVGGPLAYLSAARMSHAVTLCAPRTPTLLALAGGWATAMWLLMRSATRLESGIPLPWPARRTPPRTPGASP